MTTCSSNTCASKNQQAQTEDENIKKTLNKIKQKFIIMSGKGGVGKSSVTVNLAMALAAKGFKTGILDVDIHGPDIPRMLGKTDMLKLSESQKLAPLAYSKNLSAVSIESLSTDKDNAVIWRGPMKYSVIKQFIGEVEWGDLDFLLIDSPPGTGDEPLTIAQHISDAKAIIVTTPQEIALADVRKSINFCKIVEMEVLGIIENMSGFICPHCNKHVDIFGSGGGEKTAKDTGLNFLGKIPFDNEIVKCGDAGKPFYESYSTSSAAEVFTKIADKMAKEIK
jgi:ATP-binding protein involved in chromosome partitioning